MLITDIQREIIRCVSHRGSHSVEEVAKLLGYKVHIVRRNMHQLIQNRIIRKTVLTSTYKLGYTPNNLQFSLVSKDPQGKQKILEAIIRHPQVMWCSETMGDRDYEITFLSRTIREFTKFIDDLSDEFGQVFEDKFYAVELNHTYFGYKAVSPRPISVPILTLEECEDTYTLDPIDIELLRLLSQGGGVSMSTIARRLNVPSSSLDYRKQRLKEQGILVAELYFPDRNRILSAHLMGMLGVANPNKKFRVEFLKFCSEHPNFFFCHRCVGAWDYKVGIVGESRQEVSAALELMKGKFSGNLSSLRITSFVKEHKVDFFPFTSEALNAPNGMDGGSPSGVPTVRSSLTSWQRGKDR